MSRVCTTGVYPFITIYMHVVCVHVHVCVLVCVVHLFHMCLLAGKPPFGMAFQAMTHQGPGLTEVLLAGHFL